MVIAHPLWIALLIQGVVFVTLVMGANRIDWVQEQSIPLFAWVALQAILSVVLTYFSRLPRWWLWIQGGFPFALWIGLTQTLIPSWGFGLVALLLALIFSNVWRERVPLYLSNTITHAALVQFAQEKGITRAFDLGSGLGGVVRALARVDIQATGVEASPLLVGLARLLARNLPLANMIRGDIWQTDLSSADLVYVFLSPVPMGEIWRKACAEMPSGSWLVSNSFAIPEVEPEEVWELSDKRQTQLWLYRIP